MPNRDPVEERASRPLRTGGAARRRVLVARLDNLGDVLLAGPAVRATATRAEVTMLVGPSGAAAARLLPGVAAVLPWEAPWVGFDPPAVDGDAVTQLVRTIAAGRFDEAFVLASFHQSPLPLALLLRLAGVPQLAATCTDYPGSLLDHRHPDDPDRHEVEQALSLVGAGGYHLPPGDDGALRLQLDRGGERRPGDATVDRAEQGAAHAIGLGDDRPYVVVHPGASVPARAVPDGLAVEAVAGLVEAGWQVVVTGTGDEGARLRSVLPTFGAAAVDLVGALDLPAFAATVRRAAAVVCGNTGAAHVAAAVATPVVSVFAPVVPLHRWRPWMVPHVVLGVEDIACRLCRARTCPETGQPCVGAIGGADVVAAVHSLCGPSPSSPPRASSVSPGPSRPGPPALAGATGGGTTC